MALEHCASNGMKIRSFHSHHRKQARLFVMKTMTRMSALQSGHNLIARAWPAGYN
jgi:hypothetical protein